MASPDTSRSAGSAKAANAAPAAAPETSEVSPADTGSVPASAAASSEPAAVGRSDPTRSPPIAAGAEQKPASAPRTAKPRTAAADDLAPQGVRVNGASPGGGKKIGLRQPQFMISTKAAPGLQPLSADLVEQQLRNSPNIEFVKRIEAPRVLDLQSVGGTTGSIMLARMDFENAKLLQTQAGPRATVERDMPLVYSLDPGPADLSFKNPGVLVPHAAGFVTTIEVMGDGAPLAGAEVYIFGSVWPTQGVTDATGRCTLSILGESPDTIRAVYVKPKLDYWSFWMPRPALVPSGVVSIEVKPLGSYLAEFPDRQLIGWGGIAMGLDQVPLSMNGAGVKIAIIDSGAAQLTHRNLRQTGPGLSVVGPTDGAWTDDTIGHGSHVAGVIAGGPVGPEGVGVRGFAPGAEIHICRIFPGGRFSDLVAALDYCMENGIDVVNMSLGGGEPSQIIEERLIRAKQMGTACIVAAGNSGGAVQFPASTPHALAVAAIGKWGEFPDDSYHTQQALGGAASGSGYFPASFSCFGPEIDVCAPGVAIVSSLPPDGFAAWDGTSMAAPHVTGLAALVLAHHPDFKDSFRPRDARRVERLFQIIKEAATPLSVGGPERQGAGLPSAPRALGLLAQPAATVAAAGAMPPDASLEALRKLLALMQPQAVQPPQGSQHAGGEALQPAAAGFAGRAIGENWSNGPTSRGPASIDLAWVTPWILQNLNNRSLASAPALVDINALRQAMGGRGNTL